MSTSPFKVCTNDCFSALSEISGAYTSGKTNQRITAEFAKVRVFADRTFNLLIVKNPATIDNNPGRSGAIINSSVISSRLISERCTSPDFAKSFSLSENSGCGGSPTPEICFFTRFTRSATNDAFQLLQAVFPVA